MHDNLIPVAVKMETKIICVKILKTLLLAGLLTSQIYCKAQTIPQAVGFAHNDYCHKHPLFDALENGYTNMEADIFLKNDSNLIVAHIFPYFKHNRTLENLYLKPLFERVQKNNGLVYANYHHPVTLMIDIKSNSDNTYKVLMPLLQKYKTMLTGYENGKIVYRAVTVVLSGHKPYGMIEGENNRYAFIDEDLRRVGRDSVYNNVFSMASCKYSRLLKWGGRGDIPLAEKEKLCTFVYMAHLRGTRVRLWASPERKAVWDELLKCGVDLINTDQLVTLKNYLNTSQNSIVLARVN